MTPTSPTAASASATPAEHRPSSDSRVGAFSRPPCLTEDERRWAGDKFSRNLKTLSQVQVFWLPKRRIIVMRCTLATRVFRLPPDEASVSVGTYEYPFNRTAFLEDLEAMLVKLQTLAEDSHDESLITAAQR